MVEPPSGAPSLSVAVVIVSDTTTGRASASYLARNLAALAHQSDAPAIQVIVPYHRNTDGIDRIRAEFPDVELVLVQDLRTYTGRGDSREHHDELRAHGLARARGDVVALLEDHAIPDPRWCAAVVEAHRGPFAGYAAVGGAIENGVDRPLNWAVYFCDFARYGNPVPEGPSRFASDANVSYKRTSLGAIEPLWRDAFHETTVNEALLARGERIGLSRGIVVSQHRSDLRLGPALRERYIWGRSYAATRATAADVATRRKYAAMTPLLPAVLTLRMAVGVRRKRRHVGAFVRAMPFTVALLASWSLGELSGYRRAAS